MKTILIRALFLFIAAIAIPAPCNAAVSRVVKVSYKKEFGWSQEVKAEVTFASGSELNDKSPRLGLRPLELYALIWFEDDQVAIVKLDNKPMLMGFDGFTAEKFKDLYFMRSEVKGTQVNDGGNGRRWNFKAKEMITWIDPRVEG